MVRLISALWYGFRLTLLRGQLEAVRERQVYYAEALRTWGSEEVEVQQAIEALTHKQRSVK